jgi:lysophospholipase L1-like esterase
MRTFVIAALSLFLAGTSFDTAPRIFLIGDSTMADKPLIDNPEHGWGQMLPVFFSDNVRIYNHAKNGRSTRSFLYEGRWDAVMQQLREGDYVFIQFGHNDSKKEDTARFADPHTDYKNNLIRFVREARSKHATPVLLTPVNRRKYDTKGSFIDQHGAYPAVVRMVAANENVPLIDLHEQSKVLMEKLGEQGSKELFLMSVKPGIYHSLFNGKDDNTHFTRRGALVMARFVAEGIKKLDLSIAQELRLTETTELPGTGRVIGLDYYYNNEWKKKDTSVYRYHYIWEDTTDSGFSEWGRIFDRLGADTDTMMSPPSDSLLRRMSVYIIVDPDTPKETEKPRTLQQPEIEAIERWVRNGGVLVLMANDKGNCEFDRLNMLAERFGLHFNEDLNFDVKNNVYDQGKITGLPGHPMFRSADHLFMKQVSSLSLTGGAEPVLVKNGVTIIAVSRIGSGTVVAIGDPWLYNEYLDNRRVPAGYENAAAAQSAARWLCEISSRTR